MTNSEEFNYEEYEEKFREIDKKEYRFLGEQLFLYLEAMEESGFARPEAMQLVGAYTKFIYDMGVEEFIRLREERWAEELAEQIQDEDDEEPEGEDE